MARPWRAFSERHVDRTREGEEAAADRRRLEGVGLCLGWRRRLVGGREEKNYCGSGTILNVGKNPKTLARVGCYINSLE
jgi:hypothetical protein